MGAYKYGTAKVVIIEVTNMMTLFPLPTHLDSWTCRKITLRIIVFPTSSADQTKKLSVSEGRGTLMDTTLHLRYCRSEQKYPLI